MSRHKVLLLCGGQSDEHEVSLSSARSVVDAARSRFDVVPLVITKDGGLLPEAASKDALELGSTSTPRLAQAANGHLTKFDSGSFDIVFPLLHGPYGEDGTVQGLLELVKVPYVGSGVLASAVGMDKLMMKAVFAARGFPQVRYAQVDRSSWREAWKRVLAELADFPMPAFVKPANLGSSVGISRARNHGELPAAIDEAARFDRRIIIEHGLIGARELEVAVLGNELPEASPVGEIVYRSDFYDYHTKYTEGEAELIIPAELPSEVAERCRSLAVESFRAIDGAGLARVDFFYLEDDGTVLINEINTMPGFTATSMYPKLWQAAGVDYATLVERLLELALERR